MAHDVDVRSCVGNGDKLAVMREAEGVDGVAAGGWWSVRSCGRMLGDALAGRDSPGANPFREIEQVYDGVVASRGQVPIAAQ